jgi:hypothetical protein
MLNWPLGEAVVGKSRGRGVSKRKEGATVTHIDFWASANRIGLTLLGKSRQWHHLAKIHPLWARGHRGEMCASQLQPQPSNMSRQLLPIVAIRPFIINCFVFQQHYLLYIQYN